VADRYVIPAEHRHHYAEKVVWLPDSYQVNDSKRRIADGKPTREQAGLPPSGFVFCCFNNNYKITPDVFDRWMTLLNRVTGSVLWLLEDNAAASRNLRKEAACRGVKPDRLVFAPRMELDQHLARHQLADLFLDTLPCNAHTTASDALWAGLPVLTCMGGTFAGRVAAGLLAAAGVPELITRDLDEYEALALKIALTPSMLDGLRTRLTRNRANAPLFDAGRFCRHLEQAYIAMWERAQRGEPPAHLEIDSV
jgi:protein O-GlcNAc transferase